MIVAGVVGGTLLMAVPGVGPVLGGIVMGAAISAGTSMISQTATNGSIDWGRVGTEAVIGGVAGAFGGAAGMVVARGGGAVATAVVSGGVDGGIGAGASYLFSGGPHTVTGLLDATARGTIIGAGTGGIAHGATSKADDLFHGIQTTNHAGQSLRTMSPRPTGACDVLNGVRLRAQLAGKEIAGGHAFGKHVVDEGQFPGITSREQLASNIENVMINGTPRHLPNGKSFYWLDDTVVIRNPRAADGGTSFKPDDGYQYFISSS